MNRLTVARPSGPWLTCAVALVGWVCGATSGPAEAAEALDRQIRRPVQIDYTPERHELRVVNRASRTESILSVVPGESPRIVLERPLPSDQAIPAGWQRGLTSQRADGLRVVADPVGGELAVYTAGVSKQAPTARFTIDGHNIRGLAWTSGGDLLIAHQMLYPEITTTQSSVHWGAVLSNVVRTIPASAVAEVLAADRQTAASEPPRLDGDLAYLGSPDEAAGDPGAMVVGSQNQRWICFSGTGEVAKSQDGQSYYERLRIGRRPVDLALDEAGDRLFVVDEFSDTVVIVRASRLKILATISLGPAPEATAAQRGEALFYNALFSRDGWFSCHSCHTDGHSNGLASANFPENFHELRGDYAYNIDLASPSRQVPTLLGVADTGPWGWGGQFDKLEDQVHKSLEVTMQSAEFNPQHVADLTAFLKTLEVPAATISAEDPQAVAGRAVFERQGCADCHAGRHFTTAGVFDVGVHEKNGRTEFNPPSLRAVGHRRAFLHDGRATTLDDAVRLHQPDAWRALDASNRRALVRYLQSL